MGCRVSGVKREPARGWTLLEQLTQDLSECQGNMCQVFVFFALSQVSYPWEELT